MLSHPTVEAKIVCDWFEETLKPYAGFGLLSHSSNACTIFTAFSQPKDTLEDALRGSSGPVA